MCEWISSVKSIEENSFENKYRKEDQTLGTLNNQLLLKLNGYAMEKGKVVAKTYNIDVNDIKNNEYIIKDIEIRNGESEKTTNHEWSINMIFRNYRDYDQVNNSGKEAVSHITFKITKCTRISD